MNIIIFGGSGRTGSALVQQSLQQGHHVTLFLRRESKFNPGSHEKLTVIYGNLRNAEQVRAAVAGKDAVISALGVSKTLHHDAEVIAAVKTIAEAMNRENINRFIYLSVFLAYSKPKQFSFFVNHILKRIIRKEVYDHEVKEKIIRDFVKEFIIVRAVRLTQQKFSGRYRHGENIQIKNFIPSISRADVAHFILCQLVKPTYINTSVLITGS